MAVFMDKQTHHIKSLMAASEIERLTKLIDEAAVKLTVGDFIFSMYPESEINSDAAEDKQRYTETVEYKKLHDQHYKACIKFCETKCKAWQEFINYEKEPETLNEVNEAMDDWLQKGWLYLGQDLIVEQSQNAIEEYNMFKILLNLIPTKQAKKPTRRGGKKHKRNKKK